MSNFVSIFDHGDQAVARLATEFRTKPKLVSLVRALIVPAQNVENALGDLRDSRWLDTAEGTQLDNIGYFVGQPRNSMDDATYVLWLQGRILVNRSLSTGNDSLLLARLLTGDDTTIEIEYYPDASYEIRIFGIDPGTAPTLDQILDLVRPAGVHRSFVFSEVGGGGGDDDWFQFASGDTPEVDAAHGFSDDAGVTGGKLAGVL